METQNEIIEALKEKTLALGAFKANVILESEIVTDASFRDICAKNSCGMYGKCWTCPPDAGEIHDLMKSLSDYKYLLLYQTVGELEDSFDFEGMQFFQKKHNAISQKLRSVFTEANIPHRLHLGAGGCGVCDVCAKRTGEPCRHPALALSSLEAYGVYVSKTAEKAGMKYINGKDTVTYFGAVFFDLPQNNSIDEVTNL